jgi:hypothetical protein
MFEDINDNKAVKFLRETVIKHLSTILFGVICYLLGVLTW